MRGRSAREKIPGIPAWLSLELMTTVTKQPGGGRGGGGMGLDVKDTRPVNGALSLELKQLSGLLTSLPALWRAMTQCGTVTVK